ncbi:hypothetical protein DL767_010974 [Monosporascus sp. MG133]|nr:hypothetical protein DL767_010974 [Monosporascus sp. MG133]
MKLRSSVVFGISALEVSGVYGTRNFQRQCRGLAHSLDISGARDVFSEFVPSGTVVELPVRDPSCNRTSQEVTVNLCRVGMSVSTSERSGIYMEAWLPEHWSGRFLHTGNGGLGGCIMYEDIEYAASFGFASVGTNNGHDGMYGDAFLHNPDVVADYAYRAVHTGVVVGKDITGSFYGTPHTKSYFLSCSAGGRSGFKEAQDFPEDFDGIIAGAPAINFNNITSWSCSFLPTTGPVDSPTFVPMDMWPIIHDDILAQCDEIDGLRDGILESPDLCDYTPDGLICAEGQTTGCLTPTQAETVRTIYSPLLGEDGSLTYPRMQPGSEDTEAPAAYYYGVPFIEYDWFRYVVFNDSNWDPFSLAPPDYTFIHNQNPFDVETWKGDLSGFKERGGKMLTYHGLKDGIITSEISPLYYEHVSETMGLSPSEMDDFYRLFRISGMAHCEGGPGAAFIGNTRRNMATEDPDENVLWSMVRWVEQGIAPDTITGTAYVNGSKSAGVAFKRKHCRWPFRNVYQGGDPDLEDSWGCVYSDLNVS